MFIEKINNFLHNIVLKMFDNTFVWLTKPALLPPPLPPSKKDIVPLRYLVDLYIDVIYTVLLPLSNINLKL